MGRGGGGNGVDGLALGDRVGASADGVPNETRRLAACTLASGLARSHMVATAHNGHRCASGRSGNERPHLLHKISASAWLMVSITVTLTAFFTYAFSRR